MRQGKSAVPGCGNLLGVDFPGVASRVAVRWLPAPFPVSPSDPNPKPEPGPPPQDGSAAPSDAAALRVAPRPNLGLEFEQNPTQSEVGTPLPRFTPLADADRVREGVRRIIQEGAVVGDVARELGLAPSSIYRWQKKYVDFLAEVDEHNRPEDWKDVYTWTGAPEIEEEWKLKFQDNWQRLLEETKAEEEDFKQDPLEVFLHNSMFTGWLYRDGRLDRNTVIGGIVGAAMLIMLGAFLVGKMGEGRALVERMKPVSPYELSQEEYNKASAVATSYLEAPNWKKRLAFVRNPQRVAPVMEKWYASHPDVPAEEVDIDRGYRRGEVVSLMVLIKNSDPVFLALVNEEGGYKVDWESSSGYQAIDWKELMEKKPTAPVKLRCLIEKTDYFSYGFSDASTWYAFKIRYPRGGEVLYGYAEKPGALGAGLEAMLGFDPMAGVILEVAYPVDAKSNNQVKIIRLVQDSWIDSSAARPAAGK